MGDDLSALFAEQQTNQIDWDGPLYSLFELPSDASELTIRFLSAKSLPPQGLRLKAGSIASTVFPAEFISRFRRPGIGRRR